MKIITFPWNKYFTCLTITKNVLDTQLTSLVVRWKRTWSTHYQSLKCDRSLKMSPPYEVGLVGRAAKKLSPLLDPVTWHHDLKNIPVRYPCVLGLESSRYVAKTTAILWLLTPSCRMWVSAEYACWENVWLLPFIFWTRDHAISYGIRRITDRFCW